MTSLKEIDQLLDGLITDLHFHLLLQNEEEFHLNQELGCISLDLKDFLLANTEQV